MDFKSYKPRPSASIDGILRSRNDQAPAQRPTPQPLSTPVADGKPPIRPLAPSPSSSANQPSMLNRSLPNPQYGSLTRPVPTQKKKKKWSRKRKVLTSLLVVLIILVGGVGWFGARIINDLDKVFHGNPFSDFQAIFSSTQLKGESVGRVNILLAGDSADDPSHSGALLTDSIMVLSIDTKNHTAFELSIPRDLWVYIPGLRSYQKINAANDVASFQQAGYPSGGMGQLQQVVQNDLGIPIDYYALIDYTAFRDAVNAVGGVTIDIQSSDPRGMYDSFTHLKLSNGEQTLNGQEALDLARARGDTPAGDITYGIPSSDFTRTMYQREMLIALASKAKSIGVITNPLKITSLFDALGNNVQTDLNLQDVLRLVEITKGFNTSSVGSHEYSASLTGAIQPLLTDYTDPASGQEALIPTAGIGNYGQLQQYYLQLTSNNPVVQEGANIVVLNGSNVNGLAGKERTVLQTKGIDSVNIADASNEYPGTMIVDQSKGADPATAKLLTQLFPGTVVTSYAGTAESREAANYPNANFVVILGENWDPSPAT
jgi:polyisoprenyl-teichoic acid--peptidoglycan teichoic acid transferase